jgi:hypothetical protein
VNVCQPANGCHVEGDLCRTNADCCGGDPNSGLPGAGNVTCMIAPGAPVGYCSGPNGCRPEGDTCHYLNYACGNSTKADDCCPPNGKQGVCQLDPEGVPRCRGVGACVASGGACSNDLDCCAPDGGTTPCVPGPNGTLVCGQAPGQCQMNGSTCTVNADCCSGLTCIVPPGGTMGSCGVVMPPPPPPTDGGTPPPADGGLCALYGQTCTQASDCCNGVPCSYGMTGLCSAGQVCTCINPVR